MNNPVRKFLNKPVMADEGYIRQFLERSQEEAFFPLAEDFKHPGITTRAGQTLIVHILGPIAQRADIFTQAFGWATTEELVQVFTEAETDTDIQEIVMELDTPGGEVSGLFELVEVISRVNQTKPVFAVVNEAAFSAGYAIASAAEKIILPETASVGSIGVINIHMEHARLLQTAGIGVNVIRAGKRKAEVNSLEELPEGARERLQQRVDRIMDIFVSTVARNRGLDEDAVREMEAGIFMGSEAIEAGLADEAGTFQQVLQEIAARDV